MRAHFQEANESMLQAMEAVAAFARDMQNLGADLRRTPTGLAPPGRVYKKWLGLGDYSYTPPIEGDAFKSDPGNRVLKPLLHSLGVNAGPYHTHTRGLDPERDENYSEGDKDRSDGEGTPSYLGTPRGMIYKYLPIPNRPSQGDVSVLGNTNGPSRKPPARP